MLGNSIYFHFLALTPNHVQIVLFIVLDRLSIGVVKHSILIHIEPDFLLGWLLYLFGSNLIEKGTVKALCCGQPLTGIHLKQA